MAKPQLCITCGHAILEGKDHPGYFAQCHGEQRYTVREGGLIMADDISWETAMHRVKALLVAIRMMGNEGLNKEGETHIVDLAAMGEEIIEDQFEAYARECHQQAAEGNPKQGKAG